MAVSTTADVSPGSGRGQGKASKAGRQPALRPAGQRPLLPILGEPAQSWSNLRDSQSVAGMADPPTAPARETQQAPPQLSPLSGAYLLIVVGEPFSEEHKKLILQKLQQGKRKRRERPGLSTQSREVFRLQIGWFGDNQNGEEGGLVAQQLDLMPIGLSNAIFILTMNKRRWRLVESKGGQIKRDLGREYDEETEETVWEYYEEMNCRSKIQRPLSETPKKKGNSICQIEKRAIVGANSLYLDKT